MAFWKRKQKRQTTAKKKPNVALVKPKSEYKPPVWEPTIKIPDKKTMDIPKSEPKKMDDRKSDYKKEFLQTFRKLTYRHRAWDIWKDFIVMFACSLSNPVDKAHYEEREKKIFEHHQKV